MTQVDCPPSPRIEDPTLVAVVRSPSVFSTFTRAASALTGNLTLAQDTCREIPFAPPNAQEVRFWSTT